MSATGIEHTGVIFDIVGDRIDVAVEAQEACASCQVKSACAVAGGKEKEVSVVVDNPELFSVGEKVTVSITKAMGMKAVFLVYVTPLILMLGLLLGLHAAGAGEIVAGVSALAAGAAWFLVLKLASGRIENEISFKIRKYDE